MKGKEKIRALKVQNALLEEDSLVKKVAKQLSNTGQLRGQGTSFQGKKPWEESPKSQTAKEQKNKEPAKKAPISSFFAAVKIGKPEKKEGQGPSGDFRKSSFESS